MLIEIAIGGICMVFVAWTFYALGYKYGKQDGPLTVLPHFKPKHRFPL